MFEGLDCLDLLGSIDSDEDMNLFEESNSDSQVNKPDSQQKDIAIQENNNEKILYAKLPWWEDDKRAVPNDILRSALFGIVPRGKRKFVKNKTICSNKNIEINYTGEQLDQADLDVWEQCLHLFRNRNLDNYIVFKKYDFLKEIGRVGRGGSDNNWLLESLTRISAGIVSIKSEQYTYIGHLIDHILVDNKKKKYAIQVNQNINCLFHKNCYTKLNTEKRQQLKGQLSIWLFRFYSSHKKPFPIHVETIQKLCGSEDVLKSFKQNLKKNLETLSKVTGWTCWIDKSNKVFVKKTFELTGNPKRPTSLPIEEDDQLDGLSPF